MFDTVLNTLLELLTIFAKNLAEKYILLLLNKI